MIGTTEVTYGSNIKLVNVSTLKFEQTPVRDSSGQVDQYDRFTVRVSGFFLAQAAATAATHILPKQANQTAGEQFVDLRTELQTRRLPFKMTLGVGGPSPTVILQANPLGLQAGNLDPEDVTDLTDVANGPIPEVISVQRITGNASIRVEVEFAICLRRKCSYLPGGGNDIQKRFGVLSNRWSCADDINENFFTVRTWVGELKMAHPFRNPHEFRALCVPPVQPGMRRSKMSFVCSEDALSLRYTVTDEEVYLTAPTPAESIHISHRELIAENEINVRTSFSVTVKGDRTADKKDLLLLCSAVADGKLRISQLIPAAGIKEDRPVRMLSYEMFDEQGTTSENKVQIIVQLLHLKPNNNQQQNLLLSNVTQRFGTKLDGTMVQNYVNTLSRGNRPGEVPVPFGPIPLVGAFTSFLQSACTSDFSMASGLQAKECAAGIIAGSVPEVFPALPQIDGIVVPEVPDLPDETFSIAHKEGIYQSYEIDSEYRETTMVIQMPIAKSSGSITAVPISETPSSSSGTGGTNPVLGPVKNPQPTPATSGTSSVSANDNSAFVRLGPSQFQRVVRIVAERTGQPPRLPVPVPAFIDSDGIKNVLLSHVLLGYEPTRTPTDETRNYVVRAEYVYGMSGIPGRIKFGVPDYESTPSPYESNRYQFSLSSIFSSDHPIG